MYTLYFNGTIRTTMIGEFKTFAEAENAIPENEELTCEECYEIYGPRRKGYWIGERGEWEHFRYL